jgi:hypothetical protein
MLLVEERHSLKQYSNLKPETVVFKNENSHYQNWVKNNPHGFVVNTRQEKSHPYRVAHKTSCQHISGSDNAAKSTKNYIKICATDLTEISDWFYKSKVDFDGQFHECGKCKPNINELISSEEFVFGNEITNEIYNEGYVKKIMVNSYERNLKARKECVEHHGSNCSVCGFNFSDRYGDLGNNFIHVHHLKPLHKIKKGYEVNPITDLIPVCPNCHVMLHRRKEPLTITQLRALLK